MLIFHGTGLLFELCDRRHWLSRFKQRNGDRRTYVQMLPLVLFNQCCIMLPCMVACQALGLAFVGTPHLGATRARRQSSRKIHREFPSRNDAAAKFEPSTSSPSDWGSRGRMKEASIPLL